MSTTHQSWEYRCIPANDDAALAQLGQEGWELVGFAPSGDGPQLYLKRPALDFRERVTMDQKRHVYTSFGRQLPAADRRLDQD